MKATSLLLLAGSIFAGCASGNDELAAEQDAEDAADGKGDAASFPFGIFYTNHDEFVEKEAMVAAFHKPDGAEGIGESGHFDLTRYDAEIDSEYLKGTFKTYTYGGRNRIRFQSYEGIEVLRSDWKVTNGMLKLDASSSLSRRGTLPEYLVDCITVEVIDSNSFEEGLSIHEYPDVSVSSENGTLSMSIGAASVDQSDGTVVVSSNTERFEASGTWDTGETFIVRVPLEGPRRGEVIKKSDIEEPIAEIVCR